MVAGGLGALSVASRRFLPALGHWGWGLGHSSGTRDRGSRRAEKGGGVRAIPKPHRQPWWPALLLGLEFPTGFLTPDQCRAFSSPRRMGDKGPAQCQPVQDQ